MKGNTNPGKAKWYKCQYNGLSETETWHQASEEEPWALQSATGLLQISSSSNTNSLIINWLYQMKNDMWTYNKNALKIIVNCYLWTFNSYHLLKTFKGKYKRHSRCFHGPASSLPSLNLVSKILLMFHKIHQYHSNKTASLIKVVAVGFLLLITKRGLIHRLRASAFIPLWLYNSSKTKPDEHNGLQKVTL